MIDIILTIVLGSLAGVAAFLSCMIIWKINPAHNYVKNKHEADGREAYNAHSGSSDLSEVAMLRLSVDIKQQELAVAKDGTTVTGFYINIERNMDGMQTCNKIFLN